MDVLIEQLTLSSQNSLDNNLYENAIFLCEKLYSIDKSEKSLNLLATSYMRSGKPNIAYKLLVTSTTASNKYLFAQACILLGKYQEAEISLRGDNILEYTNGVPNGANGLYLLGQVYQRLVQKEKAIKCYRKCLTIDPSMWCAIKSLCELGDEDPSSLLNEEAFQNLYHQNNNFREKTTTSNLFGPEFSPIPSSTPIPFQVHSMKLETPKIIEQTPLSNKDHFSTPPPKEETTLIKIKVPQKHGNKKDIPKEKNRFLVYDNDEISKIGDSITSKLSFSSVKVKNKTNKIKKRRFTKPQDPSTPLQSYDNQQEIETVVQYLRKISYIYWLFCQYKCKKTLEEIENLPDDHKNNYWVWILIGRCNFELTKYKEAEIAFERARRIESYRTEGMEWYSSTLWHLKKESKLSTLAQELVELDRLCPQSWCAVGNCFSLQKEHDVSLKFFYRSIQLDSRFEYAYTLCGHEYAANEDLDKALSFFQNAINLNPRHVNAWYGLGMIYYRTAKFDLAYYHFDRALKINSESSALLCYMAMVLMKLGNSLESLKSLEMALNFNEFNFLAKYKKAEVLVSLRKYDEALIVLNELKLVTPKEGLIYFLLGKISAINGDKEQALVNFSIAQDLETKISGTVKTYIDKLSNPENEENEEDTQNMDI